MAFKNFVVFYTKGDRDLGKFLTNRAMGLGYKSINTNMEHVSVTLDTVNGMIKWTADYWELNEDHELGNFQDFLTTDKYRYVPPKPKLMVGNYEVDFYNDYMKVGCQHIPYSKVEEIIRAYKEYLESIPF